MGDEGIFYLFVIPFLSWWPEKRWRKFVNKWLFLFFGGFHKTVTFLNLKNYWMSEWKWNVINSPAFTLSDIQRLVNGKTPQKWESGRLSCCNMFDLNRFFYEVLGQILWLDVFLFSWGSGTIPGETFPPPILLPLQKCLFRDSSSM